MVNGGYAANAVRVLTLIWTLLCRNIDPALSWGTTPVVTPRWEMEWENVGAMLMAGLWWIRESLGFFFDIDAKLILIHTKSREGINIIILT